MVRWPHHLHHHLQLESPNHIHLLCVSKQTCKSTVLWMLPSPSPRANFIFLFPTTSEFKKFKLVWLGKIVFRCQHHLQLESPPYLPQKFWAKTINQPLRWLYTSQQSCVVGVYAPVAMEGNIVVDGILASCYPSCHHDVAHIGMTSLSWFPEVMQWIFGEDSGFLVYITMLDHIGRLFLNILGHLE